MQKKLKGLDSLCRSMLQKRTKLELIDDLCSLMSTYGLHVIDKKEERDKRVAGGRKRQLIYVNKKKTFVHAFNKLRMEGETSLKSLRQYLEKNHPDPNPNPNPKLEPYWYRKGTETWFAKLRKGQTP